ncbi:hypothetical protein B9Q02_05610 [Candidatus Marsarchaeota G1 archaeon BE_D]|jgi:Domain of unknown function (DUF929).|uniref:DUF929 domain-containing protein n=3 Tax=Candidatus Marsarchaeota TaxID=1978152 RepID=A0A2R6C0F4_9ARCH|nr:MAG: hypothetical protein B9Q02_05610 [Candidatus Marsarchaeota G1 archaeon BE_D]PSO04363.1 MAG: hypothetical protein B9Q12_02575 [Candidatus Marsarchaeota G2 archaeon ECH_B_SAG-G06]
MPGKKLKKKMEKQARKARQRRTMYLSVGGAVIVVIALLAYYGYVNALSHPPSPPLTSYIGEKISPPLYSSLVSLSTQGYGYVNTTLVQKEITPYGNSTWLDNGKPIIVYIGGEYCPYCAAVRWPLVLALLRFGNFSGLEYMLSSSTDYYPNTPTFTFVNSSYTSEYIVFQPFEAFSRTPAAGGYQPLQSVPPNYSALWNSLTGGGIPFIDLGGRYVIASSLYDPGLLQGLNWTQVVQKLETNSRLALRVYQAANAITATICKIDGNKPSSVCSNPNITQLENALRGSYSPLKLSFQAGTPDTMATTWTNVQYTQIAPTKNSEKTR